MIAGRFARGAFFYVCMLRKEYRMKHFKILFLGLLAVSIVSFAHAPVSIKEAKKAYADAKMAIVNYYIKKDAFGLTGFECELACICEEAKQRFIKYSVTQKDVVVFDIDETLLSNLDLVLEENFESKRGSDANHIFRVNQRCTPIKPTIEFCAWLRALGYKVVFITSRRLWMKGYEEGTRGNLAREGVSIDDQDGLFLLEQKYAEGSGAISIGAWKRLVRDDLRKKSYNIVACIGDDEGDLAGADEAGVYNVKLPNYLY